MLITSRVDRIALEDEEDSRKKTEEVDKALRIPVFKWMIVLLSLTLMMASVAFLVCRLDKSISPGEPLTPERLPHSLLPEAYKVHLRLALPDLAYVGSVEIDVNATEEAHQVVFHSSSHLAIIQLKLAQGAETIEESDASELVCHKKFETCVWSLENKLEQHQTYRLSIAFTSKIREQALSGLYVSQPKTDSREMIVSTQLEPTGARRVFPCFDEPHLKATFDVAIDVQEPFHVLSNTPVKSIEDVDGFKRYSFQRTPFMSTYLFALVVSTLEMQSRLLGDIPISIYHQPGQEDEAKKVLEHAVHSVECLRLQFGPYPFTKLDLVPVKAFGGEAMENVGLLIFEEARLMLSSTATLKEEHLRDLLVTHEIVHQWFGDLVTMTWWDSLFLNEAFAEYFQYLCLAASTSQVNGLFFEEEALNGLEADAIPELSRAVYVKGHQSRDLSLYFDDITYNKGAAALRMLHMFLDQGISDLSECDKFCSMLKLYLQEFALKTASVGEWLNAMDALQEPSTLSVSEFMHEWLVEPGFPVVEPLVYSDKDHCLLQLKQRPFSLDRSFTSNVTWKIPLKFTLLSEDANSLHQNVSFEYVLLTDRDTVLPLNVNTTSCHSMLPVINLDSSAFVRVQYSLMDIYRLSMYLQRHRSSVNGFNRSRFVSDVFYMFHSGRFGDVASMEESLTMNMMRKQPMHKTVFKALWSLMKEERDGQVWETFRQGWFKLYEIVFDSWFEEEFMDRTRELVRDVLKEMNQEENQASISAVLDICVMAKCADFIQDDMQRRFDDLVACKPVVPSSVDISVIFKSALHNNRDASKILWHHVEHEGCISHVALMKGLAWSPHTSDQKQLFKMIVSMLSRKTEWIDLQDIIPLLHTMSDATPKAYGKILDFTLTAYSQFESVLKTVSSAKWNDLMEYLVSKTKTQHEWHRIEQIMHHFEDLASGIQVGLVKAQNKLRIHTTSM